MDGTIPRGALPQALARIRELSEKYGLGVANVFHAGDGNLHPLILYDANKPGEMDKAEAFGADILRCCVELGGVLTGEHGVGIEKRDLMPEMFSEIDLNQQQRLKCAFDAQGLLNPARCFRRCTAAPNSAAFMSTAASWRFRICRDFDDKASSNRMLVMPGDSGSGSPADGRLCRAHVSADRCRLRSRDDGMTDRRIEAAVDILKIRDAEDVEAGGARRDRQRTAA